MTCLRQGLRVIISNYYCKKTPIFYWKGPFPMLWFESWDWYLSHMSHMYKFIHSTYKRWCLTYRSPHVLPYFVSVMVSSACSFENVHLRRLVWAFVPCDKYQNIMKKTVSCRKINFNLNKTLPSHQAGSNMDAGLPLSIHFKIPWLFTDFSLTLNRFPDPLGRPI